jgi:hypothetical protein
MMSENKINFTVAGVDLTMNEQVNPAIPLVDGQKFNKPSLSHEQQTEFDKPVAHAGGGKPWLGLNLGLL